MQEIIYFGSKEDIITYNGVKEKFGYKCDEIEIEGKRRNRNGWDIDERDVICFEQETSIPLVLQIKQRNTQARDAQMVVVNELKITSVKIDK